MATKDTDPQMQERGRLVSVTASKDWKAGPTDIYCVKTECGPCTEPIVRWAPGLDEGARSLDYGPDRILGTKPHRS